ncbi:MBL fold metallo-hydrolase [Marinactinospora thermotolerans]|uniref:L-ascorbate metabolism protein UlaG, beta-lactamase superfamily n=1 Tax=Marinactinospora thermotolerans DSM 45154 TaxID=1122192 RepID=A0A1T4NEI8_9ACTN|nr:MBL fold metallo-hydrolase [Marinactinospora thermotolerans]SJZ77417.1 L-ascorbate metabolism protein UlaG, beta-lactamase superfamily [Marinactinospora thermotolerans DSM 45154]
MRFHDDAPGHRWILFVGNATTIIRWDDVTVMTDPNFLHRGQWAYLGKGLVSRRRTDPALGLADLPPLDAIVLSHLHGDHFDRVARRGLDHDLPILTTPHAARRLHAHGFARTRPLRTWQESTVLNGGTRLRVTSVPGRHGPALLHRLLPPVMGSVLEFGRVGEPTEFRLYVSGDTLMFRDIAEIPRRFPGIDAALVHLGGTTLPGGILVTMDGGQGTRLVQTVGPERVMPIHYDDYGVFTSPLSDFQRSMGEAGLDGRIRLLPRGEAVALPG